MATKSIRKACDDIPNAIKKEDKRSGQKPDLFAFNKVSYLKKSNYKLDLNLQKTSAAESLYY